MSLRTQSLPTAYALFFVAMLLLFVNTSPVNALTVSCLPASARATGTAVNVLLIHLFGDAISPELVGIRSTAAQEGGMSPGDALAHGLEVALPAVILSGLVLFFARSRQARTARAATRPVA